MNPLPSIAATLVAPAVPPLAGRSDGRGWGQLFAREHERADELASLWGVAPAPLGSVIPLGSARASGAETVDSDAPAAASAPVVAFGVPSLPPPVGPFAPAAGQKQARSAALAPGLEPRTDMPAAAATGDAPVIAASDAAKLLVVEAPKPPKPAAVDGKSLAAPEAPKLAAGDAAKPVDVDAPKPPKPGVGDAPELAIGAAAKPGVSDAAKPLVVEAPKPPKLAAGDAASLAAPAAPKPAAGDVAKPVDVDAPKPSKLAAVDAKSLAAPAAPKLAAGDVAKPVDVDAPKPSKLAAVDAASLAAPAAPKLATGEVAKPVDVDVPKPPKPVVADAPKPAAPAVPRAAIQAPDAPTASTTPLAASPETTQPAEAEPVITNSNGTPARPNPSARTTGSPAAVIESSAVATPAPGHGLPVQGFGEAESPVGTRELSLSWDRFGAELPRALRLTVMSGGRTAVLHLQPPELGTIRVRLELRGADLTTRIETERPEVAERIERLRGELERSLESVGIRLDQLHVEARDARTHAASPLLDARREGQSGGQNGTAGQQGSQARHHTPHDDARRSAERPPYSASAGSTAGRVDRRV